MEKDWLLTETRDGIVTITFNRPEARNAMTGAIRKALCDQILVLDQDDSVRALVFKGAGGNFVAGGDLKGFAETLHLESAERQGNFVTRVNEATTFITTLANFSKPVISVIDGDVAGAGISIALASDFVVAGENARFTFAHAHVGLALDLGLSYFLPRIVGTLEAKRLTMLGAQIKAEEAKALGLITSLVEDTEAALEKLLAQIGKMSVPAMAAIKAEINASSRNNLNTQLGLEARMVGECAATDEFKNRVAAFVKG
ncbi:hypothetical protein HBA55_04670 [Pseudomaricurvus alkylphenolicus]|jgi:2-(1,2-epoxy-1,2-dihydrophenyl)acetyl-CoA isomerase|uniref:enoyl-CoA hydratase/isomerase family protein n=1 Tax=Pseudomaricurvus alkylphenolicus TaxID=1306991 RepID=UPI00142477E0|nr:enoyl-CoA hydratase-related protein [Pseudomaricurvus alkylphenolicus]NIB38866.1 hypothetical protein [Pseudomaricurvus alkylphenolicus]